jgi:hypothetical protein
MAVDRTALQRRWVHAHEEDSVGEMVFRPDDVPLPPSRGRLAFELRPDGSYAESAIGPTDRPQEVTGTWELADDDRLVLSRSASDEPKRVLRVISATPDRLVVAPAG